MIFHQFLDGTLNAAGRPQVVPFDKRHGGNLLCSPFFGDGVEQFLLWEREARKHLAKFVVVVQYHGVDNAFYHGGNSLLP